VAQRHGSDRRQRVTFQSSVWAVDGNQIDASLMRLMLQAQTSSTQGVANPLDCIVNATGPATAGIIITSGGFTVLGQETTYQGSYAGWNIGNDTTLSIAPTGGSPRSDMIVARVEDPTWAGSPWGGSPAGQIIFPRVISGVSSSATQPPGGISAIPLARIDMPASVSVVQQGYITDLRGVSNPQSSIQTFAQAGPGTTANSTVSTSTAVNWPPASFSVAIPSYATKLVLDWDVYEVTQNGEGDGWARGNVMLIFGASVSAPALTTPASLVSIAAANAPGKHSFGGAGNVSIPAGLRGTTQTLQFSQIATSHNATMGFGEGSSVSVLLRFAGLASLT
jgi:hypothetical protein